MRAAIDTAEGVVIVDLEEEEVLEVDADLVVERTAVETGLPLVVTADQSGPLVAAVVARRPPLVISRDAGATWHEAGHGLPAGRAVAVSQEHPDLILFAGESRLPVAGRRSLLAAARARARGDQRAGLAHGGRFRLG